MGWDRVELSTKSNKAQMLVKDNFRLFNTMTDMGMNQPARSLLSDVSLVKRSFSCDNWILLCLFI